MGWYVLLPFTRHAAVTSKVILTFFLIITAAQIGRCYSSANFTNKGPEVWVGLTLAHLPQQAFCRARIGMQVAEALKLHI